MLKLELDNEGRPVAALPEVFTENPLSLNLNAVEERARLVVQERAAAMQRQEEKKRAFQEERQRLRIAVSTYLPAVVEHVNRLRAQVERGGLKGFRLRVETPDNTYEPATSIRVFIGREEFRLNHVANGWRMTGPQVDETFAEQRDLLLHLTTMTLGLLETESETARHAE